MPVDTAKVLARRQLHFESLQEVLAEAERLAAHPKVELLGNWSLGQIFQHLAAAIEITFDGSDYRPPLLMRLAGPLLKGRMLNKGITPGIQLPREMRRLLPRETTTEQGLAALRQAVARLENEVPQSKHFVFGKMTPAEWVKLHLRHGELHLSFAVPNSTD